MRHRVRFLSKAYDMPGWRVGFAAGNPRAVRALRTVKTHTDSGTFGAVRHAAAAALDDSTGQPRTPPVHLPLPDATALPRSGGSGPRRTAAPRHPLHLLRTPAGVTSEA
ncbi:aminotransferase class I/II-fold pyridoxal phosphate-dependent enzyme [Streptomyces sp. NPDC057705]|uniref:aminotransferase class I/II-fold pyridoxal phosphate-dependent enzyme n=1 Tax=Streptomyces sp. NPDC057705 TaxID=3346222 RepID=UPI00368CC3F1